jgi:NAD(P)-dependent dehydrogenase (short-subunit alcohol dehydrogenase family)
VAGLIGGNPSGGSSISALYRFALPVPWPDTDLDLPDLAGRTHLLTGSTSGIGRGAARRLGARGATVLVHGRDAETGGRVVREMADEGGSAEFFRADFASLGAVRDLAATVRGEHDPLDALCNNAGLFTTTTQESDDGYELTVAVNHLAPFLLTHELAGHLVEGAWVVTSGSEAHRSGSIDFERFHRAEGLSGWSAYADSKLANVPFTRELARRRPERHTANCLHPGVIPGSGFSRGLAFPFSLGWKALQYLPGMADTVEDGGRALASLAASPDVADVSGGYFDGTRWRRPAPAARADPAAHRLRETSADLVGVDPDLPVEGVTGDG